MPYQAEYIWLDGKQPTAQLRNKTKIMKDGASPALEDLPIWRELGDPFGEAMLRLARWWLPATDPA